MVKPRILVFAGSLRIGAFSIHTANVAEKTLRDLGADVTRITLGDYPMPLMDQNLEAEKGIPEQALALGRQIVAHDGLLIASPEYNASIPPLLKNSIDWVSRIHQLDGEKITPLSGKIVALCSSSAGAFGGLRGLYHLRAVLMNCQAEIVTAQCSIPAADKAFDETGALLSERTQAQMTKTCRALIERASFNLSSIKS